MEAITSQIYNLVVDRIIKEEDSERKASMGLLMKVVKSHYKIMKN
jgi:leucyl-tRNA synthetase|tara:strand:- start:499 stop:633 length:135 start_codon:yes stop_codon:yes gene_type:complete